MKRNFHFMLPQPLLLLLLLPLFLNAQWNYSGSFQPVTLNRTSDFSAITLPFRIAELEVGFTTGNFDFKTNSALEYRWSGEDTRFDIREAYLTWYPRWGEVNLGKQIHAWGAVDGNNPTDNLNPYDYYFMFLPGTDRKIGTLSASVKTYWNDWQFEAVVIPEHVPNRLPFGDKDFPILPSFKPTVNIKIENPIEFGFQIQNTIRNIDLSISYFDGYDRSMISFGMIVEENDSLPHYFPQIGYRKTQVIGANIVAFIGDITIRGEGAYFSTNNYLDDFMGKYSDDGVLIYKVTNHQEGNYFQYAFQMEYPLLYDILFNVQLIGNEIINVNGKTIVIPNIPTDLTKDNFQPGMGTPFAIFTDLGMFLSTSGNLWDNTLEIRVNTFLDLEDSQSLLGGGFTYSPIEDWEIDCSISKFMGDEGTRFKELEDFSHVSLGIKYRF